MNRNLVATFIALCSFTLHTSAQLGTASPYSMYGLGEVNELVSGRLSGMGGTAVGMQSSGLLNHGNPASFAAIDSMSFLFDVTLSGKSSVFTAGSESERMRSANLSKMAFGFRVTRRWASSFGIMPYSSVGYSVLTMQDIEGLSSTTPVTFKGNGGLTRILFSNAFNITRDLSAGVNTSFIFGKVSNTEQQGSWNIEKSLQTHKLYFDFGLQYSRLLPGRALGVAGVVYGYRSKLEMNQNVEVMTSHTPLFEEHLRQKTMYLPSFFGAGVSYTTRRNMQIGADYMYRAWSANQGFGGACFKDTHRVSMGFSIVPDAQSPKSYFDRIAYQAGCSVGNSYLSFNGKNAMQATFNLGAGLPFGSSVVDVVYSYGFIGRTGYKQLQEKFHKITIGLTLRETWFYKYLYD